MNLSQNYCGYDILIVAIMQNRSHAIVSEPQIFCLRKLPVGYEIEFYLTKKLAVCQRCEIMAIIILAIIHLCWLRICIMAKLQMS